MDTHRLNNTSIRDGNIVEKLGIDYFVTEMILRAYNLMVETERVHQSESAGFNASVHGWNKWEALFDTSKEQKRFSADTLSIWVKYMRLHK